MRRIALLAVLLTLSATAEAKDPPKKKSKKITVSVLILQLAKDDKADAAEAELVERGKKAVPTLIKALANKNEVVRKRVAAVLGKIGPPAAPAAAALMVRAVKGETYCLEAAGKLGPKVVGLLAKGLKAKDEKIRVRTAELIGAHGDKAKAGVGGLTSVLARDKKPAVRAAAAAALGRLGKAGLPSVGALIRALKDKEESVGEAARAALNALSEVGSKGVKKKIAKALAPKK